MLSVSLTPNVSPFQGTESFQAFSLPLEDEGNRERVQAMVGDEAEYIALVNCVMERHSLDTS